MKKIIIGQTLWVSKYLKVSFSSIDSNSADDIHQLASIWSDRKC
jgi:hypothetical protein